MENFPLHLGYHTPNYTKSSHNPLNFGLMIQKAYLCHLGEGNNAFTLSGAPQPCVSRSSKFSFITE